MCDYKNLKDILRGDYNARYSLDKDNVVVELRARGNTYKIPIGIYLKAQEEIEQECAERNK